MQINSNETTINANKKRAVIPHPTLNLFTHPPHTELVIGIHIGLCGVTISVKFHFIVYMPVGFSLLVYRAVEQEAT